MHEMSHWSQSKGKLILVNVGGLWKIVAVMWCFLQSDEGSGRGGDPLDISRLSELLARAMCLASSGSGWSHKTCCASYSSPRKCELFKLQIVTIRWQSYCFIHGVKVVSSFCASCSACWKKSNLIFKLCRFKRYLIMYCLINVSIVWQYRKPTCQTPWLINKQRNPPPNRMTL